MTPRLAARCSLLVACCWLLAVAVFSSEQRGASNEQRATSRGCVYWTQGVESRADLDAAGIKRICVAPDRLDAWKAAGVAATPMTESELASRVALPVPGTTARPGVASPTRSPWIIASGWRFMRAPGAKYTYTLPAGKGALAAAEAFAYGADAVLKVDAADLKSLGALQTFLDGLPAADLPAIADLGVIDDGSDVTGEVMNLLTRRNLLFQAVKTPSSRFRINIALGSKEYPLQEAAEPSAFALKIRRQLTDELRSLRIFGSEVIIGHLTGDGRQARLHLLNYAGREIEGLRIRVRGAYRNAEASVAGSGRLPLEDLAAADGAIEFTLPRIAVYAAIDLSGGR
jgi:hypothetical protein